MSEETEEKKEKKEKKEKVFLKNTKVNGDLYLIGDKVPKINEKLEKELIELGCI